MNILFIGGFDLPNKNAAAQRIMAMAEMLVTYGHRIDIIGLSKNVEEYSQLEGYGAGINIVNTPYPKSKFDWVMYLMTLSRIRKTVKLSDYNVVLCYNYPAIAFIRLSADRCLNKYSLISDITEWYTSEHGGAAFRIIKKIDVFLRMRLSGYLSDRIIVASNYLQEYYKNSIVLVLPTLVPKHVNNKSISVNRDCDDRLRFIYAGFPFYKGSNNKFSMKDRIDNLIESFQNLNCEKWKLDIYGIAENEYCELLGKKNRKFFGEKILFHGRVSRAQILSEYSNSHYSVFFRDNNRSNKSGFPTKLSESFELCVPVITNDVGDSKFYIGQERGFIFPTKSDLYSSYLKDVISLGIPHSKKLRENIVKNNPLESEKWRDKLNKFIEGRTKI